MIQRIQTLYLALAAILGVVALLNPVVIFLKDSEAVVMGAFTNTANVDGFLGSWPIGGLWILCIAFVLAIITQYKNRKLQITITTIFVAVLLLLGGLQFLLSSQLSSALGTGYKANYNWSIFLPFASAVLVFLARTAIKKDENLVRSVDRLR